MDLGSIILKALSGRFPIEKEELGADASLSKSGFHFETETYTVGGVGHLCVLRMKAMLGLMKMETVVLSSFEKDLPLLNLDWVGVPGKETLIAELYDSQLQPWPQSAQDAFEAIKASYADLKEVPAAKPHWYDALLYPCSCHKSGKGVSERLSRMAEDYTGRFAQELASAPACDREAKRAKVRSFAETLFEQGGPAVDQVTKLFGREVAGRLILRHMYGVE